MAKFTPAWRLDRWCKVRDKVYGRMPGPCYCKAFGHAAAPTKGTSAVKYGLNRHKIRVTGKTLLQFSGKIWNCLDLFVFYTGVLGQGSTSKWILGTIEFIWARGIPRPTHHKMTASQNHFVREPCLIPKRSPGQNVDPRSTNLIPGSTHRPRA